MLNVPHLCASLQDTPLMHVALLIAGIDQALGLHRWVFLWQAMCYDIVALRPAFPSGACQDAEVGHLPKAGAGN